MKDYYRLTVSCPDRPGIVAAVADFIGRNNGWITEASHHSDPASGWFFMRNEVLADSLSFGIEEFREQFSTIADRYGMEWKLTSTRQKPRIVLMTSKESHCFDDLMMRWKRGELPADICAVISNHNDMRGLSEWLDVPYHHVPVDKNNKEPHFAEVERLIDSYQADSIVLARYMQILPAGVCEKYSGKIINIHHSFLPSFAGAQPYHQAAERGVKLIGATCHYVTSELDAGPIIEQDVLRINHADTIEDMQRKGRDVERVVLARGLRYHLEDRVILHGKHTVVFD